VLKDVFALVIEQVGFEGLLWMKSASHSDSENQQYSRKVVFYLTFFPDLTYRTPGASAEGVGQGGHQRILVESINI
jgi:hypothetical protein